MGVNFIGLDLSLEIERRQHAHMPQDDSKGFDDRKPLRVSSFRKAHCVGRFQQLAYKKCV